MYLVRFIFCYMTMEYILHFMYVVAIKDTKSWAGDSPAEIAMIGFWNLIIVWLKVRKPSHFASVILTNQRVAPHPMEILPCMGIVRWRRSAWKHGTVYGEQLLDIWILEELA